MIPAWTVERGDHLKRGLDADRPIFVQIKEHIEDDILSGRIAPGEQIPSTNQLVSFYGINPVTALKGINLLSEEGIVFKKRGIGMFVHEDALKILRQRYRQSFVDEVLVDLAKRAAQLDIELDELKSLIDEVWARGNHRDEN